MFPRIRSPGFDLDDRTEVPASCAFRNLVTIEVRGPGTSLFYDLAFIPICVLLVMSVSFNDYNIPEIWISLCF